MRGVFSCLGCIFWIAVFIVLLSGGTVSSGDAFLGALAIIGIILLIALCIDLFNKPKRIKEDPKPTGKIGEISVKDVDLGDVGKCTPKITIQKTNSNSAGSTSSQQKPKKTLTVSVVSVKNSSESSKENRTFKESSKPEASRKIIPKIKEPVKSELKEDSFILTIKQRQALMNVAVALSDKYCVPDKREEVKKVLIDYMHYLKFHLAASYLKKLMDMQSIDYTKKDIEVIKSIQIKEHIDTFVTICLTLVKLGGENIFVDYEFTKILKDIGFSQEEINKINNEEYVYKFKRKDNKENLKKKETSVIEKLPVSKEQLAIFRKSWTLPQFRKAVGVEDRVESRNNHSCNEGYKVCIFLKNLDHSEFEVGFSNSLGDLTIDEIQRREKELMVGLSEYGRYKLYDDKIPVFEEIDLSEILKD